MQQPDEDCTGCALIKLEMQSGNYAFRIEQVREVVEGKELAPYPETQRGHLGIVNIRGQVLSVLDPFGDWQGKANAAPRRLVILDIDGGTFCVGADRVQKVIVPPEGCVPGSTINVANRPVRLLSDGEIAAWT
jgi:chemotaxis signal transduction protein